MTAAAKTIVLRGDPNSPEAAQYRIEIPGANVEITRIDRNPGLRIEPDGLEYWIHVSVNHGQTIDDADGHPSRNADVIDARIDRDGRRPECIHNLTEVDHVAFRIRVRP